MFHVEHSTSRASTNDCPRCSMRNVVRRRRVPTSDVRNVPRGTSVGSDRFCGLCSARDVSHKNPQVAIGSARSIGCEMFHVEHPHLTIQLIRLTGHYVPLGTSASNDATRLIDWRLCSTWNIGRQRLVLREQQARCSTWNVVPAAPSFHIRCHVEHPPSQASAYKRS